MPVDWCQITSAELNIIFKLVKISVRALTGVGKITTIITFELFVNSFTFYNSLGMSLLAYVIIY